MNGDAKDSAGNVSQRNTGGINVANTGVIETLVVHAGIQPPEKALWIAPPPAGPVVHRPELAAALRDALLSETDGPVAIATALEGAGGFGKTTLAADLCHTDQNVRDCFPGGLLWVTLGQNVAGAELAAKVNGVCGLLSGQEFISLDPQQAGFRLGALLSQRPATLLVVDDVWHSAQLAPFLIGAPLCRRLITTRNVGILPRDVSPILVDAMEDDEAVQALTYRLPGMPQSVIDRLVTLTGRWPVLLSLVNAAMVESKNQGATVEQAGAWAIERLVNGGPAALDVDDASSREHAVEATVQASLDLMNPQERELYFDLAIFPEDVAVPSSVLASLWSKTGGLTKEKSDRLESRLTSLRLASRTWEKDRALQLHDVLRSYLRHRQGAAWLTERNRTLIEAARSMIPSISTAEGDETAWWRLPDDAEYLWGFLAYHLAEADAQTELADLVCDPRWLLARTERHGPVAVGGDLALSETPLAAELRHVVGRQAHLLGQLQPGLADTFLSRVPVNDRTEQFHRQASRVLEGARLAPLWRLPDLPDPDLDRTLEGHTSAVRACAASPNGRWLASAGFDRSIRIWNVQTGSTHRVLHSHGCWIWECAWTPDNGSIVSAGDDGTVRVWDMSSGECRLILRGHEEAVTGCAVAPDGTWVASSGVDGTVRVWDSRAGVQRASLTDHTDWVNACAIASNGRMLVSSGADRTVRVWDPDAGQLGITLFGDTGGANACAIAPDASWIAAGGSDSMVRVWRPRWDQPGKSNLLRTAAVTRNRVPLVPAEPVRECAASPDGSRIVSVSTDGMVRVWDVDTATELAAQPAHTGVAQCCTVSPDGSWFVSGGYDGTIHLWQWDSQAPHLTLTGHSGWVERCVITPGGTLLASVSDDGTLRLWDTADGALVAVLAEGLGQLFGCAVSRDGTRLASAGADRLVRLWDIASRRFITALTGHTNRVNSCAFSADGAWLASASFDGTIRTWDTATGTSLLTMKSDGGAQWDCTISPNDTWIASASTNGTIRIWEASTGRCCNVLRVEQQVRACTWMSDTRLCVAGDAGIYVLTYDIVAANH